MNNTWISPLRQLGAFVLLISLAACGSAPNLDGAWIITSQYRILGADTIFSRSPVLLDFKSGGQLDIVSFADEQGLNQSVESLNWRLDKGKLILSGTTEGQAFSDTANLISNKGDELHLSFGQDQHRRLRRLPPSSLFEAETLRKELGNKVWTLSAATLPMNLDTSEVDIEFFTERYVIPQAQQDFPLIWGLVQHGPYHFLIIDGMAGHLQSWDLIELTAQDNGAYQGRYYLRGQALPLSLKPSAKYAQVKPDRSLVEGSWTVELADTTKLIPEARQAKPPYEQFQFQPDGRYTWQILNFPTTGRWTLSRTGNYLLLLDDKQPEYRIIRIAEMAEDKQSFLATYRSHVRNGLNTPAAFTRRQ